VPVQEFGRSFEEFTAEYLSYVRGYIVYEGFLYQRRRHVDYVGAEVRYPSDVDVIAVRPGELLLVSCTENLPTKGTRDSRRGKDLTDRIRQLNQALPYVKSKFGRYRVTKKAVAYFWKSSRQSNVSKSPGVELLSFDQMLAEIVEKIGKETSGFTKRGVYTDPMLWLIARLQNRKTGGPRLSLRTFEKPAD